MLYTDDDMYLHQHNSSAVVVPGEDCC